MAEDVRVGHLIGKYPLQKSQCCYWKKTDPSLNEKLLERTKKLKFIYKLSKFMQKLTAKQSLKDITALFSEYHYNFKSHIGLPVLPIFFLLP